MRGGDDPGVLSLALDEGVVDGLEGHLTVGAPEPAVDVEERVLGGALGDREGQVRLLLEDGLALGGDPQPRAELRERVWGGDYDTASNVVDVYVGYLRKKLDGHGHLIETVRGVGYRLVTP